MTIVEHVVDFIPSTQKRIPPTKYRGPTEEGELYTWYITKDEYLRLNKIFGRDFQEVNLGGTQVIGLPSPCNGCGKYTEFIDWVWTALRRGVHSRAFMFEALKNSRQPQENMHDVYCSECGTLTVCRSRNNAEGGAPSIFLAGRLQTDYLARTTVRAREEEKKYTKVVAWGEWWLNDKGSIADWQASRVKAENPLDSKVGLVHVD